MLTVLCWYWRQPGGRTQYQPAHVNIWADMVSRHLSMPHRLACVTDHPEGIDPRIEIISPPRDFEDVRIPTWPEARPQCLRRLAMFAPDAGSIFGERFVSMDIDCVIGASLDPLFDTDADFKMCQGTAPGRPYNGSLVLLTAGARPQVYERFTPERATEAGRKYIGSDQAWIAHILGPKEQVWTPDDGVCWHHGPGNERRVMFYPGSTKPWDLSFGGWVAAHYRREPQPGRCLILGYAPSVWAEAEEAMSIGGFEAVIASPEAAEHWPGPIVGVAQDDAHAERLAKMHGYSDVTFCGRTREAA